MTAIKWVKPHQSSDARERERVNPSVEKEKEGKTWWNDDIYKHSDRLEHFAERREFRLKMTLNRNWAASKDRHRIIHWEKLCVPNSVCGSFCSALVHLRNFALKMHFKFQKGNCVMFAMDDRHRNRIRFAPSSLCGLVSFWTSISSDFLTIMFVVFFRVLFDVRPILSFYSMHEFLCCISAWLPWLA